MTEYQKLYADRDPMELDEAGDYYSRHVFAMTAEGLHSKAAIAEELAFRDKRIDDLKRAYWLARNSAAGLTNLCEESGSSRRCERELEEAERIYRGIEHD